MVNETILRIPRSDSAGDFVLVKVSRTGSSDLNLKLAGTEGENPYVASVKASQIDKLRAKNYRGSDDEWSGILSYVFNQDIDAATSQEWVSGLEVIAAISSEGEDDESDKELVITLRKRIDSITQRLGTVTLTQDDDYDIQLFDWTASAVSRANNLNEEITGLKAKYREAESTIKQLNAQLEELITAKNDHDDQLIGKFVQLLNEKKLKIRNQQRLLATAKVDPAKAADLDTAIDEKRPRKPDASRRSKRKAEEEASESEDGFEAMEIDKKDEGEADEQDDAMESERQSTPEPLEDETASEIEDEDGKEKEGNAAVEAQNKPESESKGSKAASASRGARTRSSSAKPPPAGPPPRRELPFLRRPAAQKSQPADDSKSAVKDEDSETEDDEL